MAKDSTHPQMIKPADFNYRLKNYLRDFYIYGFKESDPEGDSDFKQKYNPKKGNYDKNEIGSTFSNNLKRLKNLLQEECGISWVKQKTKVNCCTTDTRALESNPFFRIYKSCLNSSEACFFTILFALSPYIKNHPFPKTVNKNIIIDKVKTVAAANELKNSFDEIKASYRAQRASESYKILLKESRIFSRNPHEWFENREWFKNNDEISAWNDAHEYISFKREKLDFETMKFVEDKPTSIDGKVLEGYYTCEHLMSIIKTYGLDEIVSIGERRLNEKLAEWNEIGIIESMSYGKRKWYKLSGVYLKNIVPNETLSNFIDMVQFFSETSPLGEIGQFVLRNMSPAPKLIKQKHYYIKNVINDYNNIALLCAIKSNAWIKVQYRNAIDLKYQEFVCFPLQLRESTVDGRQYVIYYNPCYRSVSALRIEFIDKIEIGTYESPTFNHNFIIHDIDNAKYTLCYLWNTGYDNFKIGNLQTDIKTKFVKLTLRFKNNESHVKERLLREKRHGEILQEIALPGGYTQIDYGVHITSFSDMIPWIRSFIQRIVSIKIDGMEYGALYKDIEDMINIYSGNSLPIEEYLDASSDNKVIINNTDGFKAKEFEKKKRRKKEQGKKVENQEDTSANPFSCYLFNEIYGTYYTEIGNIIVEISNSDEPIDELEIRNKVAAIVNKNIEKSFNIEKAFNTESLINNLIDNLCLIIKKLSSKHDEIALFDFCSSNFADIIPLSKIECQWLMNILNMPKARLFLNGSEIDKIKENIFNLISCDSNSLEMFDIRDFNYHDQFVDMANKYKQKAYIDIFKIVLRSIKEQKILKIKYLNNESNEYVCKVAYIEYSKRDDRFRIYALDKKYGIIVLNMERIQEVVMIDQEFNLLEVRKDIESYYENNKQTIEIMFTDSQNVPDRILTEFSPWEKECLCIKKGSLPDKDNKKQNRLYTLTLKYDASDVAEIVTRLLGYGPYIFIIKDTGGIKKRFENKLEKQRSLSRSIAEEKTH